MKKSLFQSQLNDLFSRIADTGFSLCCTSKIKTRREGLGELYELLALVLEIAYPVLLSLNFDFISK